MIDLALGKPATQSSKHPANLLPLTLDAANANRQDSPEANFHTDAEWFPWWQVDLEQLCLISEVIIYNTAFWPSRARMFSILVSHDGQTWREIFSKTDHCVFGDNDENAYKVVFSQPITGRFVRVRLDNWDYFHLKSVRIYGEQSPGIRSTEESGDFSLSLEKTVVFATNYDEEDNFLPIYISNFLNFTSKNCYIFINIPKHRKIPTNILSPHPRVHIFNDTFECEDRGFAQLSRYMASYGEALRVIDKIDYFCTCVSNGLFVRFFNLDEVIRRIELKNDAPVGMTRQYLTNVSTVDFLKNESWIFEKVQDPRSFVKFISDDINISYISTNQIEGLFAPSEEWMLLYERMNLIKKSDYYFSNFKKENIAVEELLPVTFFRSFGSGSFTNICHVLWDPVREITFPELIEFVKKLPAHMCQAKWFSRDPESKPTAAISHTWSRALLNTLTNIETPKTYREQFLTRVLTQGFSDIIRKSEVYTPLTRLWRSDARWGRVQWICSSLLSLNEKTILSPAFSGTPMHGDSAPAAWVLYVNPTCDNLQYEAVVAEEPSATTLSLHVNREGEASGRHEWGETRAILFLSPLAGENAQVFRLSLQKPFEISHEKIMYNVRRFDGYSDFAWPFIMQEDERDMRHFYFLRPESHKGEVWIGIPAFLRTSIFMELSFGINSV
ncbi:discoidin domain-containing protein [Gluconobacter cerinus]|uniref:discoidin domain-containing protein n=1 Tax=Gluconobacter cerinus TaxID=38307 RepID=UPI001B8D8D78|nr:discoidin domain-containing protein [Gluconobacter cerinus]MBS1039147.1 discoidin domain-containing protein [Gluconobacter cerinus]